MSKLAKFAIFSIVSFVVLVGTALFISYRPTIVLGYDGASLGHSVKSGSAGPCVKRPDGDWTCAIKEGKVPTRYRVKTRWDGCWNGTRISGPVTPAFAPRKISGCVTIWDHLRIDDALNTD